MKKVFKASDWTYEEIAQVDGRYQLLVLGPDFIGKDLSGISFEERIQKMKDMWGPDQAPALKEKEKKIREEIAKRSGRSGVYTKKESNWKINPEWVQYNNLHNEGGEGYNPHKKWL